MTLKFNYFAIKMCMAQVFTFWVPVLMACAATGVGLHSFEEDFAAQMFVVTMTLNFISSAMLSNDCDLRRKRLENGTGTGTGLILSLVAYLVWTFFFVMGGFPSAKNHTYSFIIGNRTVVLGSMSLLSRFMSTPILYMGVSAYYNCVHKGKCSVIKIPLARKRMPKAEVADFLKRYHKKRENAFSTVIDASMRGRRKNSNMIHSLDTLQIEDASQALRDEVCWVLLPSFFRSRALSNDRLSRQTTPPINNHVTVSSSNPRLNANPTPIPPPAHTPNPIILTLGSRAVSLQL